MKTPQEGLTRLGRNWRLLVFSTLFFTLGLFVGQWW